MEKNNATTTGKKSKIPYFFFIFFAVVFAVDSFFIYVSKKTWRGVVIEDSYEKGLNYNQTLAEEKKQEALGWNMSVSFKNLSDKKGIVLVTLLDKDLAPISDAKLSVELKRPIQAGHDFTQEIEFVGGIYEAKINFPFKGQWDFFLKAEKDGDIFRKTQRFIIQ